MVLIQIDIPQELDKELRIYQIHENIERKSDAIISLLKKNLKDAGKKARKK